MPFVLYRSGGGGGATVEVLGYSPDDPTSADDSAPFVLQTTDGTLFARQEDDSYLVIDVSEIGVINARGGLPPPTADADGKLAVSNDGVYFVDIFQTSATPATATFTTYTATGYRGAQNTLPATPVPGQSFYHTSEHQWYHVAVSNGDNYWVSGGNPSGWIPGNYTSEPDALQGINRLIASGVTTGVVWTGTAIERFSAFVAATNPETHRRWDRIASGTGGGSGGLTEAQVKAEIRVFAQADASGAAARTSFVTFMGGAASAAERLDIEDTKGEMPDGRIPATVTRDIELLDAALAANTNIRFPQSKMATNTLFSTSALSRFPAGLTRDTEVGSLVLALLDASFPAFLARDTEIATEARAGNTTRWGDAKLPTDVLYEDSDLADFPSGLTRDTEVESAAIIGNVARWVDSKLPTDVLYEDSALANFPAGLTRDSEIGTLVLALLDASFPSFLARDSEIATAARAGNTTRWTDAKLPTDVLYEDSALADFPAGLSRDTEIGTLVLALLDASFPSFLARDSEIATEALAGNTTRWGDAKLPTNVLYSDSPTSAFPAGVLPTVNGLQLVDWEPTNTWVNPAIADMIIAIEANFGFVELPAPAAFSRALTSDDDSNLLIFCLYGSDSNAVIRETSTCVVIPVSEWRNAPQLADDATLATTPKQVWFLPMLFPRGDGWRRGFIGKGANGRPGGMWADGGYITGLKVWMSTAVSTGSTTPPPPAISTHQRYGAYGADATFVATDFTGAGGVGATTNTLTISGATGSQYVAFWSAEALTRIDATGRAAFGSTNQFNRFIASRLTISSTNGYLYVSDAAFRAAAVNGLWTLE